jgi:hypothetical protein
MKHWRSWPSMATKRSSSRRHRPRQLHEATPRAAAFRDWASRLEALGTHRGRGRAQDRRAGDASVSRDLRACPALRAAAGRSLRSCRDCANTFHGDDRRRHGACRSQPRYAAGSMAMDGQIVARSQRGQRTIPTDRFFTAIMKPYWHKMRS